MEFHAQQIIRTFYTSNHLTIHELNACFSTTRKLMIISNTRTTFTVSIPCRWCATFGSFFIHSFITHKSSSISNQSGTIPYWNRPKTSLCFILESTLLALVVDRDLNSMYSFFIILREWQQLWLFSVHWSLSLQQMTHLKCWISDLCHY